MRIMFNCLTLNKGGAERVINILANHFTLTNEVKIVTNMYSVPAYDFNKKIEIESLVSKQDKKVFRKLRRFSPFMLLKLKKIILNYKPDVVISFLPEPNFKILFLKKYSKKIKSIPIIISVRNDPNSEYGTFLRFKIMKMLYPLADQMILQTDDAKKYFMSKIGYVGSVIHNPVDQQFLVKRFDGVRDKRIVAVGRLVPQKNYFNMIDAFEIFHRKYNEYILEIYGEGNLRKNLRKYINNKGLESHVLLKGKTNDIKSKIYKAAMFVMSSDYEGMPNSLLEASCLGIPCISTDCPCGGPKEILDNGNFGVLVPINNCDELAKGMIWIIENQKLIEEKCSLANNNEKKYSSNTIIKEWYKVIFNVTKGRK